jgi:H+/Cl- antiporter ClcA
MEIFDKPPDGAFGGVDLGAGVGDGQQEISGAALGPEAPLADACGGVGTLISDRLKLDDRETRTMGFSGVSGMLASFVTSPFGGAILGMESAQGGVSGKMMYFWVLFPSLLSSAVATVVFVLLSGAFFETMYKFPDYTPRLLDLLYGVPLGLVGGAVGLMFMILLRRMQRLVEPLKGRLVLRGVVGGLAMGIIGALLPLTLFSGEEQTLDLIANAAEIGVVMLIVLALAKLFATSLLLATGWKGGYIFPIMFAGVAMGMAANLVFPSIPVAVTVAATMSGAMVAALKAPLFAALFTLALVQIETSPVVAVAVVASAFLTALLALYMARRAAEQAQAVPEPK